MKLPIIIIGPMHAGKSTIANLLAKKLSLPETSVDAIALEYYIKHGINQKKMEEVMKSDNFHDYVDYMRPYELSAVLDMVNDFPDTIISFGAGHSYFMQKKDIEQILSIKKQTPNIFLLLPSKDKEETRKILELRMNEDRKGKMSDERLHTRNEVNTSFINSESNFLLADRIIYTDGKTPEQCCEEIIELLN
jgi:shikimate kinase